MITVTKSSLPDFNEYCEEIKEIWETHWMTNMGSKHEMLAKQLCEYTCSEYVELFANGHLALENAIAAFKFPPGSEVITTPFTFVSTTHAIVRNNLSPVFCDINPDDYTIDVEKIEPLITNKTVAIVPVHVYGNVCNVEKINEIAKNYNLKVIYDAAHAFGVEYKNKSVAQFGDATMMSFHATKAFNSIEGGAVFCFDADYAEKLYLLKNFGIEGPEICSEIGGNAKMNEFQAAMGICNLRHFEEEVSRRKAVSGNYYNKLKDIKGITLPPVKDGVKSNYSYYPVLFNNYKYSRDEVYEKLLENEIYSRKYFYPLTNKMDCYKDVKFVGADNLPIAERISETVLALPLYSDLTKEEVKKICEIITG